MSGSSHGERCTRQTLHSTAEAGHLGIACSRLDNEAVVESDRGQIGRLGLGAGWNDEQSFLEACRGLQQRFPYLTLCIPHMQDGDASRRVRYESNGPSERGRVSRVDADRHDARSVGVYEK